MNLKTTPKMHPMKERAELLAFVRSHAWMAGYSGLDCLFRFNELVAKSPQLAPYLSRHGSMRSRIMDLEGLRRRLPHLRGLMLEGYREGRASARRDRAERLQRIEKLQQAA